MGIHTEHSGTGPARSEAHRNAAAQLFQSPVGFVLREPEELDEVSLQTPQESSGHSQRSLFAIPKNFDVLLIARREPLKDLNQRSETPDVFVCLLVQRPCNFFSSRT